MILLRFEKWILRFSWYFVLETLWKNSNWQRYFRIIDTFHIPNFYKITLTGNRWQLFESFRSSYMSRMSTSLFPSFSIVHTWLPIVCLFTSIAGSLTKAPRWKNTLYTSKSVTNKTIHKRGSKGKKSSLMKKKKRKKNVRRDWNNEKNWI